MKIVHAQLHMTQIICTKFQENWPYGFEEVRHKVYPTVHFPYSGQRCSGQYSSCHTYIIISVFLAFPFFTNHYLHYLFLHVLFLLQFTLPHSGWRSSGWCRRSHRRHAYIIITVFLTISSFSNHYSLRPL